MVLAPKRSAQDVNVESVDMEMSSDEEVMETDTTKTSASGSVSFSLTPHVKPLVDSPLKEKEEPKKKLLSLTLTPPPRLPEPPPLPDVDEIFSELDEKKTVNKLTPPPLPPPVPPSMIQPIPTLREPSANFSSPQRGRGFFGPRFNNQRQRFPHWQNNNNNNSNNQNAPRARPPPMTGPRFRPDGNFRGRPPWFRGNRPNFPGRW